MSWCGRLGEAVWNGWRSVAYGAAVMVAAVRLAVCPSTWSAPVRRVLALQIYFTAIQAIPLASLLSLIMGVTVVVQGLWLSRLVGDSRLLGALLVGLFMREMAPLVVNFIVIGRSGTAIAAELAAGSVGGDWKTLEAQGVDPMVYLVTPRVLGMGISVFCLTVLFVALAFVAGYFVAAVMGLARTPGHFVTQLLVGLSRSDGWALPARTIVPGMATAAIACMEGFRTRGQVTEIPQAATRAVVRATTALILILAVLTAIQYG